jgi:hypothetical protein
LDPSQARRTHGIFVKDQNLRKINFWAGIKAVTGNQALFGLAQPKDMFMEVSALLLREADHNHILLAQSSLLLDGTDQLVLTRPLI